MSPAAGQDELAKLRIVADGILNLYHQGVPFGWAKLTRFLDIKPTTLSEALQDKEARLSVADEVRGVVEKQADELFQLAATEIAHYLKRYRVKSTTPDPFKLAYWFGLKLAEKLGAANPLAERCVLLVTLDILDWFCLIHGKTSMPADMREKMDYSVSQGKHFEEFGAYGLYHSFKTLAKSHQPKEK